MKRIKLSILTLFFVSNVIVLSVNVTACKNIVASGEATAGDYNLLLKVRDPSRPGYQVLCIVPEGYEYTYHHPWTGKSMDFKVEEKYIGVATVDDVIPNIVKAGMSFNDQGLAFGDADTGSRWVNPTRYAWDDFDCIRYTCEKADDEDEAVTLMTKDLVKEMHACGISENFFIVGPKKVFIVETDAFRYHVKEVEDAAVPMSTYPKNLWKTCLRYRCVASSFDAVKEEYVKEGSILRLGSLYGVKIVDIDTDWIAALEIPFVKITYRGIMISKPVKIKLGTRETVGVFSVRLLEINGGRARISLCYRYKAWEDKMMDYIESRYGSITVRDMINWSRLHREDLEGLRPMCEDRSVYESAMVYRIPEWNYDLLSCGWFAANHPCSSIYVPVHICVTDVYDPYENGYAAALFLRLLREYGHGYLTAYFSRVEDVFLYEVEVREKTAVDMLAENKDVSEFLTYVDMAMQRQAWLTGQIWIDISNVSCNEDRKRIVDIVGGMWEKNYTVSLEKMENAVYALKDIPETEMIVDKIEEIILAIRALEICRV
jgi:hypothetical protein